MRANIATPRPAAAKKTVGTQYAALPYRHTQGGLEVLLITSRRTRRWIVPKGWPIEGLEPPASAAREALEEAGISGIVGTSPIGFFRYFKSIRGGAHIPCKVGVYALRVVRQHRDWPEKAEREARWLPLAEAAQMVQEPELRKLILAFGRQAGAH